MTRSAAVAGTVVVAVVLGCSGCGDSTPYGHVTGTVIYDGQPVPAGNKIFFELGSQGYLAGAVIQEDGRYTLNYQGSPKIPLGDYVVFVGPPTSHMTEKEFRELKARVAAEYRQRGKTPPPSPDWILPAKFYQPHTSPLRESVKSGENLIHVSVD